MHSYIEFNVHFWFLHLRKEADFKKVENVANKMTKGAEQLPLHAEASALQFEEQMEGYEWGLKIMKAVDKLNVELLFLESCNRRTREHN